MQWLGRSHVLFAIIAKLPEVKPGRQVYSHISELDTGYRLSDETGLAACSQFYVCIIAQVREQPPVMITFLAWSMSEVCSLTKTASCCLVLLFYG
jgi:hypothetical protein